VAGVSRATRGRPFVAAHGVHISRLHIGGAMARADMRLELLSSTLEKWQKKAPLLTKSGGGWAGAPEATLGEQGRYGG
jgi:hypothetical protein